MSRPARTILFSNSFNCFVLSLVAATFVGTAYGMKSDGEIIAEIISMAAAIKTECKSQQYPTFCSSYLDYLNTSRTVPYACANMDRYIDCQQSNCLQQSPILIQLLADAQIMPYCTELSTFIRTPETVAILSEVADIRNMCLLEDKAVCDFEGSILMNGNSLRRICLFEKVYLSCLQNNCRNQSLALRQRITQALNKPDCGLVFNKTSTGFKTESQIIIDIKELNLDIGDLCQGRRMSYSCSYTNTTVFLSTTRQQTCLNMRDFALCSQQNCQPTQYMALVLEQAYTYPDCQRFFSLSTIIIPTYAPTTTRRFTLRPILTVPYEIVATRWPTVPLPTVPLPTVPLPTVPLPTVPWWWQPLDPTASRNTISANPINTKPVADIEAECYFGDYNSHCNTKKENALAAIGVKESCQTLKDYALCIQDYCYSSYNLGSSIKTAINADCSGKRNGSSLLQVPVIVLLLTSMLSLL